MRRCAKHSTKRQIISVTLFVLMMALLTSTGALAKESESETKSWHFGFSLYGWFPDISGQTVFTRPEGGGDFEISIDQILDNLEFALMGMFDVRKGRWGLLTDVIYLNVGNSKSGIREATIGGSQIPADASANVELDMQSWVWTLTGYYRAIDQTGHSLDIVAGARYLDVEQKVNWDVTGNINSIPVLDRTGSAKASLNNWDAIIGLRGRFAFGAKKAWFVPYYFDIGTGNSDLTWQGVAGLGYAFRWIDVVAAWRHLYYDLPADKAINDISFNGPAIGITFRW